jgi:NADPH-dependent 2,4-dienoyl-CoA reductase/sulfur reductase-like enzyme
MSTQRFVIIGNGVAGITAAQELRQLDNDAGISIISNEHEYYYRASLSEWISERNTKEMMAGRTSAFYEQMKFDRITGTVEAVDPAARQVLLGGQTISYDKLLIATGAAPNQFPIPGLSDSLVFRNFQDSAEIKRQVSQNKRVMILGGGVLGLELAGALHKLGIDHIAIVQLTNFVGGPLLDQPAAEWLQEKIRRDGITLFLSDTVDHVEGQTAYLKSGEKWDFDLFIQSTGVRPQFPEIPGLKYGRGIQINDQGQTNLPDIYAAGDCTETYNPKLKRWMTTRIWLDGARQGRSAAYAMTGNRLDKNHLPFFNASLIFTEPYAYIDEPHVDDGVTTVWKTDSAYRKIRVIKGKLAGALLIGNRHGMMAIYKAIGEAVKENEADLAAPDFKWNELTEPNWDYFFY